MKNKEPAGTDVVKWKMSGLLSSRNFVRMCVVAACFALLLLLLLPFLAGREHPAKRVLCILNLKQIGIGFRLYANDNVGHYPRSTTLVGNGYAWTNCAAAGSDISVPRVLLCPSDTSRLKNAKGQFPTNFSTGINGFCHPSQQENSLSFFYGLSAALTEPNTILAGDRNLTANQATQPFGPDVSPRWSYAGRGPSDGNGNPGIPLGSRSRPPTCGWNSAMHKFNGNVLLGDGSAQQFTTSALIAQLNASEDTNNFCLFPIKAPGEK